MPIIFVTIGVMLGIYSIYVLNRKAKIIKRANRVSATVIKVDIELTGTYVLPWSMSNVHYPTIEYLNREGEKCVCKINKINKGFDILTYDIGQEINILVDIQEDLEKSKVYIDRWVYLWYWNILGVALSILMFTSGLYEIYIN